MGRGARACSPESSRRSASACSSSLTACARDSRAPARAPRSVSASAMAAKGGWHLTDRTTRRRNKNKTGKKSFEFHFGGGGCRGAPASHSAIVTSGVPVGKRCLIARACRAAPARVRAPQGAGWVRRRGHGSHMVEHCEVFDDDAVLRVLGAIALAAAAARAPHVGEPGGVEYLERCVFPLLSRAPRPVSPSVRRVRPPLLSSARLDARSPDELLTAPMVRMGSVVENSAAGGLPQTAWRVPSR